MVKRPQIDPNKSEPFVRSTFLYTLGDLGPHPNNKTHVAKAIHGLITDHLDGFTYHRGNVKSKELAPLLPLGNLIPKFLTLVQKNHLTRDLCDKKATKTVSLDHNIAIFHPYSFPKTAEKCRTFKSTTINIGTSATGNFLYDLYDQEYKLAGLDKKFKRPSCKDPILSTDYVITYSEFAKKSYVIEGFPERNIFVCPPCVELGSKPKKTRNDKITFLAVSDYDILKGYQYLVQAWAELDPKDAQLIIVGQQKDDNPMFDKYKNHHSIKIVGHTDPKPYYESADVFVHPSLTEGFEKVTIEAMWHDMPVIVTNHCGIADIITDGQEGFITPIRDTENTKKAIRYFIDNPCQVTEMGKKAAKLVHFFTPNMFRSRFGFILKKIIKNNIKNKAQGYNPASTHFKDSCFRGLSLDTSHKAKSSKRWQ